MTTSADIGGLLLMLLTPMVLAVIADVLVRSRERLAEQICQPVGDLPATWEPAAHRLTFIFVGVLVLSRALDDLVGAAGRAMSLVIDGPIPGFGPLQWDTICLLLVKGLVALAIAAYLLCGAAHLLKWQLCRVLRDGIQNADATAEAVQSEFVESGSPRAALPSGLSWTRMGFVVLGVVAGGFASKHLTDFVWLLGRDRQEWSLSDIWASVALLVGPLAFILVAYLLIRHCDSLARRIVDCKSSVPPRWEKTAYQIAATLAGVMIVAYLLPVVVSGPLSIILRSRHAPGTIDENLIPRGSLWILWAFPVAQTGFGALLIWIAPRLIKWQTQPSAAKRQLQSASPFEQGEEERCQSDEGE